MTKSTYQFDFKDLKLNASLIESSIGYKDGEDRGLVTGLIEEILIESEDICSIKAEYVIYTDIQFNDADKSIDINKINFQVKKTVFGQLKKSESMAVFLCTAGKEIGARSREAMHEKDLLKGYIYDVVGSEIVEAAADLMQNALEQTAILSGKKITNRYSPGYCGWYVDEQHKLFQLVPDNYCCIRLTPSALMDPEKSVSGIIGIGEHVRMNPYTCGLCDMENCIYRKKDSK